MPRLPARAARPAALNVADLPARIAAAAALCLIAACNPARSPDSGGNETPAPVERPAANEEAPPAPAVNAAEPEAPIEVPDDGAGLADMSPFRRRAYEQGYRDCRAGRYEPDPWPEAYRIGCGAAQEAR